MLYYFLCFCLHFFDYRSILIEKNISSVFFAFIVLLFVIYVFYYVADTILALFSLFIYISYVFLATFFDT